RRCGCVGVEVPAVHGGSPSLSGGAMLQSEWPPQALHPVEGVSGSGGVVAVGDSVQLVGTVGVGVDEPHIAFSVAGQVAGLRGVHGDLLLGGWSGFAVTAASPGQDSFTVP